MSQSPATASTANLRALIAGAVLAVLAALLFVIIGVTPHSPKLQSGIWLGTPREIAAFERITDRGEPYRNADLLGHWSLLFPGFTHCPDICPTTLSTLKAVAPKLRDAGIDVQVLFLSVDPERDTQAQLNAYVRYFDPLFIGLTGPEEGLRTLASALALVYQRVPGPTPESYTMDHSSALVLINPQGRARAYLTPPHQVDAIVADIQAVVAADAGR